MTKSRRKRRSQNNGLQGPTASDDFIATSLGNIVRHGRHIQFDGTANAEEHEAIITKLIESRPDVEMRRDEHRSRLLLLLENSDTVDLLARLSMTYGSIDPDTPESQTSKSPAHVEYVALQILLTGHHRQENLDPLAQSEIASDVIDIVREIFDDTLTIVMLNSLMEHRVSGDWTASDYRYRTQLESIGVRGSGYLEHIERVLHGCFDGFSESCKEQFGFSLDDALIIFQGVADLVNSRLDPRRIKASEFIAESYRRMKIERRNRNDQDRRFSDELLNLPPNQAKKRVAWMAGEWLLQGIGSDMVFTAAEIAQAVGIETRTCEALLDALTCSPESVNLKHHAFPVGAHPLTDHPVLRLEDGGYLIPSPSSLHDALRVCMEELLRSGPNWERYLISRGRFLEDEAVRCLREAIPGGKGWTAISWKSEDSGSDLDGLVGGDDVGIRLQCKSGRLSPSVRRGAPTRMRHDIQGLVRDAADQHSSLRLALDATTASDLGFTQEQQKVLEAKYPFEIIVCLDEVSVWATEAHNLRQYGALGVESPIPWILSLTDLMVVVDLLDGAQLIHYLMRRQRIERDGRISAHDELDWVGHYLSEGLYFDNYFTEGALDVLRLTTYTDPIDAWYFTQEGVRDEPAPKPSQTLPPGLLWLLNRLATARPRHWVTASLALLDGDDEARNKWNSVVKHVGERVVTPGWSNASFVFDGRLGITLYVDSRVSDAELRPLVRSYIRDKREELSQPNWIAIGVAAGSRMFVELIESEEAPNLMEVFSDPSPASQSSKV